MDFQAFPKIARFHRTVVVTEKIDGTNAQIEIVSLPPSEAPEYAIASRDIEAPIGYRQYMLAASRTRFITPEKDNFNFARWVQEHADELWQLGIGRHYGEWWGNGIQRGYALPNGDKRFSLFNVHRHGEVRPSCCGIVPVLAQRTLDTLNVPQILLQLQDSGSVAAPGFMKPEGIVVFHTASSTLYKVTLDGDGHKG